MSTWPWGKIGAVTVAAALIVLGSIIVRGGDDQFPLVYVDVDEFLEGDEGETCAWTVRVTLRNESDATVTVTALESVVDEEPMTALPVAYPTLDPGNTAVATGVWALDLPSGCDDTELLTHGDLIVRLEDGTTVARSF